MATIINLTNQLKVTSDSQSVVFYDKLDINGNINLFVSVASGNLILFQGNTQIHEFDYSVVSSPISINVEDLADIINGFITGIPNGSAFSYGTEFSFDENLTPVTNSTIILQSHLQLTSINLSGGDYKISWSYEWNHDDTGTDFVGNIDVDSGTIIANHFQEPSDSLGGGPGGTDQIHQASGFRIITLLAGVHTVDINFASSSGGDDSTIIQSSLEIIKT